MARPGAGSSTGSNKAIALSQMWLFDQAFEVYARVKALDPNHAVSNWNSALLHMLTGNFEAGWAGGKRGGTSPRFPRPIRNSPSRCGSGGKISKGRRS